MYIIPKDFYMLWIKLGFGFDADMGDRSYWRCEFLYGWRTETKIESVARDMEAMYSTYDVKTKPGYGFTIKTCIGIKL